MSQTWTIVSRGALAAAIACLALMPGAGADAAKKKRGPVLIKVKAPEKARGGAPLTLRPTRRLQRVTVSVNGRRVGANVGRHKRHVTRLALGATSRVRFGRNTVVIRAVDKRGNRQTVRRRVRVLRGAPLAGVRRPRRPVQGRAVRLDARPSRPARGGTLRYRWRVVRRPARARATLRGARRARPSLKATHPGRYSLALTLVERGRKKKGARASAAGCAVRAASQPNQAVRLPKSKPAGPPPATAPMDLLAAPGTLETIQAAARPSRPVSAPARKAAPGCVTEVVHVDVQPNSTSLGIAFDSRAQQNGQTGIRVGTSFYPLQQGRPSLLVLDAHTLEYLSYSTVPAGVDIYTWVIAQSGVYQARGHLPLFVISGLPGCCGGDAKFPNDGFTAVMKGPIYNADTAQNLGLRRTVDGPVGQMSGYLQTTTPTDGAHPSYQFVSPERLSFTTRGRGTPPGENVMWIGDDQYEASLPAGQSGFHVIVMDSSLWQRAGSPWTFATNSGDPARNQQQEQQMAQVLTQAAKTPGTIVFVQSIGNPKPASPAAPDVAVALEQLGGTMWAYLGLDGSGGYALVGNSLPPAAIDPPTAAAESVSQWQGGGAAVLHGMLRRRSDQTFYAPLADFAAPNDPTGVSEYGLSQVVYQAPTAWPQTDTAGKVAATRWLAENGNLEPGPGSCYQPSAPDFRSSYCNEQIPVDTFRQKLAVDYPGPGKGFTEDEFTAVVQQLQTELSYVGEVRALIDNLEKPFAGQSPDIDSSAIAADIIEAIPPPKEDAVSGDLALASAVGYLAADVTSEVPGAAEVLGPVASALDLASILLEDGGEPSPDWDIQTAAALMGKEVETRLDLTLGNLDRYEDILLTDWGKLEGAGKNAETVWGITAEGIDDQKSTIELGIEQWLWMAILPSAYDLVDVNGVQMGWPGQVRCVTSRAPSEWHPWKNADPRSAFFPLDGWSGGKPTASRMMAMLNGKFSNSGSHPVKSDLADQMFNSPDNNGAGLVQGWLYERTNWSFQVPKIGQPSTGEVPGVCFLFE